MTSSTPQTWSVLTRESDDGEEVVVAVGVTHDAAKALVGKIRGEIADGTGPWCWMEPDAQAPVEEGQP